MSKWRNFIERITGKKYPFPSEVIIIDMNALAKKNDLTDDIAKEVRVIMGGVERSYPYSKVLVETFEKEYKLPVLDLTQISKSQISSIVNIRPDELEMWG